MAAKQENNFAMIALAFAVGALLTGLILGGTGSMDDQARVRGKKIVETDELKRYGGEETRYNFNAGDPIAQPNPLALECAVDNCDLMAKLNTMDAKIGTSTFTLFSRMHQLDQKNENLFNSHFIWEEDQFTDVQQAVSSSLLSLKGGPFSSWNMASLAAHISQQCN